ncbi:flavin reductase family protein [Croceibacterium sp. TMG7-5b_MA50]|uniref:flavin reductase family protein n=1 Tax=Croceibacterium sp. TMG7-5b_MA50 TaxID=3121290 RepID=UPI003221F2C9
MSENQPAIRETFRMAMRHIASTVHAITALHAHECHGILATAVSSLSFDPPSLLVCINQAASLHSPITQAELFGVNVLGLDNRDVAERFAEARGAERFSVGDWSIDHGAPVLLGAQSAMLCRRVDCHTFGTHTIVVGELVEAWHRQNGAPLTYYDRSYIDISAAPVSTL